MDVKKIDILEVLYMSVAAQQYMMARQQRLGQNDGGNRTNFAGNGSSGSYKRKASGSSPLYSFLKKLEDSSEQELSAIQSRLGGKNAVNVIDIDGYIAAKTPYNAEFVKYCKENLGGLYLKKLYCWFFMPEKREGVCQAVASFFGKMTSNFSQTQSQEQPQLQHHEQPQAVRAVNQSNAVEQPSEIVAMPPVLTVEQILIIKDLFNSPDRFLFKQIGGVMFCRALDPEFDDVAHKCGGVWFADLKVWALCASQRAIFAPIYNRLKNSVEHNQAN